MRRLRWTTRRFMILIVCLAMALGLGLPALEIYRSPEPHLHVWVRSEPQISTLVYPNRRIERKMPFDSAENALTPFWPRYRRYLLGRPWRRQPACGAGSGHLMETCEFACPEMKVERPNSNSMSWTTPPRVAAEADRRFSGWKEPVVQVSPNAENR